MAYLARWNQHGQLYAYRVDGPYEPEQGHRFNFNKLLMDPCAKSITRLPAWNFQLALGYEQGPEQGPEQDLTFSTQNNSSSTPKCVFVNEPFDWGQDEPLRHPWSKTVIYETHVRGFTIHPTSGVEHPGTYRGLIEKIPYFKTLGITAIELMPVQEFNECSMTLKNPETNQLLRNYWGYESNSFLRAQRFLQQFARSGQRELGV